ncbi:hypothetical protein [Synechococcus phage S-N03]|uniref:Uncharacterized protein n=1 Tax=Synechococcus phage S-N03 TaxID=2718943 RepID=A0A6G8R5I4_9CAUD|nr:hypothetical protein PQC09_gp007 [Synechococcus phage S-N03]QIN96642.1 hypothetical protein [Synechococcus phage S-N03]
MAITFPTDPGAQTPANTFSPSSTPVANSANGNTYVWNGTAWTTQQANLEQYVNVAGDTMTGPLTGTSATYSGNIAAANIPTQGSIVGYQQGLWTPTAPGTASIAPTAERCVWTRTGNEVTVWAYISQINSGSTDGTTLYFKNLPYPILFNGVIGPAMIQNCGRASSSSYVSSTSQGIAFYESASATWQSVTLQSINSAGNNGSAFFGGTYITDDTTWTPINGATVD